MASSTDSSQPTKSIDMKVVLVGSVGVGKTSTVLRFVKDNFKEYLETTIGASYMCKTIPIDDKQIKFSVWDTAGQEQYHSLVPLYFRKANAVIVVYDITRQKTFEEAKTWIKELPTQAPEDVIIALTANKSDLNDLREIERHQGENFAKSIGAIFNETSAKSAAGITEVFQKLGKTFLERQSKGLHDVDQPVGGTVRVTVPGNGTNGNNSGNNTGTGNTGTTTSTGGNGKTPCCGG